MAPSAGTSFSVPRSTLSSQIDQPPLVGQKDFARIEVFQALQPVATTVRPDHPAMRNKEFSKLGRFDHLPVREMGHGAAWTESLRFLQSGRIHRRFLPALTRRVSYQPDSSL